MLKAIHAQENKAAAKEKAKSVISRLREMKLNKAADKLENGLEETLTYTINILLFEVFYEFICYFLYTGYTVLFIFFFYANTLS